PYLLDHGVGRDSGRHGERPAADRNTCGNARNVSGRQEAEEALEWRRAEPTAVASLDRGRGTDERVEHERPDRLAKPRLRADIALDGHANQSIADCRADRKG